MKVVDLLFALLAICVGWLWVAPLQAAPAGDPSAGAATWEIAPDSIRFHREPEGGWTPKTALRALVAADFGSGSILDTTIGWVREPVWLLVTLDASAAGLADERLLVLPEGRLRRIQAWVPSTAGAATEDRETSLQPLTRRPYRYPVFVVPAVSSASTVLLRIATDQPLPSRWLMYTSAEAETSLLVDSAVMGAAYAVILVVMLLEVLMLIAAPRLDQWMLLPAFPLIALDLANRDGILPLAAGFGLSSAWSSVLGNLMVVVALAVYLTYLDLPRLLPAMVKPLLGFIATALAACGVSLFIVHHQALAFTLMALMLSTAALLSLYLGLRGESKGWIGAALALVYGAPLLLTRARDMGGVDLPSTPPVLLAVGVAVTMLGILVAISHRFYQVHREALQSNRALEVHKRDLENTVAERTADLAAAADRAERANRAKDDFLARMSHELRTPLNAILGYAQWLADGRLDAEQERSRKVIESAGRQQLQLVDDLLDVSRIESGRLELKPAPLALAPFFDTLVASFRIQAARKGLELAMETGSGLPDCIRVDEGRLRQLLGNYLGNAIKYTERGSVRFTVEPTADPGLLRFEVQDSGPGIADHDLERLFEPFFQGSHARAGEGIGLGLAICRRLAEAMGGSVGAASRIGEGSRFHLLMPFGHCGEEPLLTDVPGSLPSGYDGPPREVLVVDDTLENGMLMRDWLQRMQLGVEVVTSGEQALQRLDHATPNLILLDIRMPGMDGYQTLERMRARPGWATPVVAISASVAETDRERVLDAGFDGFIPKPVEVEHLTSTLGRLLHIHWRWDEPPGDGQSPLENEADDAPIALGPDLWSAWQALGEYPSMNQLALIGEKLRDTGIRNGDLAQQGAGAAMVAAADSFDPERCADLVASLSRRVRQSAALPGEN